jgi:hypothetical protein
VQSRAKGQERVAASRGCLHEEKRQVSSAKKCVMAFQRPRHVGRQRVTHVCFEVHPQQEWQGRQQR